MIDDNTPSPTPEQIAEARENALNASRPASWVWNEELVSWVAPVAPPADGFPYIWEEGMVCGWVPFPDYPRN